MAPNDESWIDQADGKSVAGILLMVIGGPMLAFGEGAATAIFSLTQIYSTAADAIGDGAGAFIRAFSEDPAKALGTVIQGAADSFQSGPWEMFGPLQLPNFAAVVLLTAWQLLYFLDQQNSDIPFTGMNIPLLGNDSDGQED